MSESVRDVMTADVRSVGPEMPLPELERCLIEERLGGFPVVTEGRLVGIVSRSDVVRQLCVEQTMAEQLSDFYADLGGHPAPPAETFADIGRRVGTRIEGLAVKDVMIHDVVTVSPDEPLAQVAATLVERHIHRLPVVEGDRLVGIVTSLDLVRLLAAGRR